MENTRSQETYLQDHDDLATFDEIHDQLYSEVDDDISDADSGFSEPETTDNQTEIDVSDSEDTLTDISVEAAEPVVRWSELAIDENLCEEVEQYELEQDLERPETLAVIKRARTFSEDYGQVEDKQALKRIKFLSELQTAVASALAATVVFWCLDSELEHLLSLSEVDFASLFSKSRQSLLPIIPLELILCVADQLRRPKHIYALARSSRSTWALLENRLYRAEIAFEQRVTYHSCDLHPHSIPALQWASHNGHTRVVQRLAEAIGEAIWPTHIQARYEMLDNAHRGAVAPPRRLSSSFPLERMELAVKPPLLLAVEGQHKDVVRVLLDGGADPEIVYELVPWWREGTALYSLHTVSAWGGLTAFPSGNSKAMTPLGVAVQLKNQRICDMLWAAGAWLELPSARTDDIVGRLLQQEQWGRPEWPRSRGPRNLE